MATKYWVGGAETYPSVVSITLTGGDGDWATGDTVELTFQGKTLKLTVGDTSTVAQILADCTAMVNGSALSDGATANALGSDVGEWSLITCTNDGADTLTFTGPADGRDCTGVTISVTTAGLGSASAPVPDSSTGTGSQNYDNADNWSGGAVPSSTDDIVFDHRASSDCLYGLAQSAVTPASITITEGFTRRIGLPDVNTSGSVPFEEWEDTHLALGSSGTINLEINSSASSRIRLDTGAAKALLVVNSTGPDEQVGVPSLTWKGTHVDNEVTVNKGSVGIALEEGVSSTVKTLRVGYTENRRLDSNVTVGKDVTLTNVIQTGGICKNWNTVSGTIRIEGGQHFHHEGTANTVLINGGTYYPITTGTTATLVINSGGTYDARRDNRSRTITNADIHAGGAYLDPNGTVTLTNGLSMQRTTVTELNLDLPTHQKLTITSL